MSINECMFENTADCIFVKKIITDLCISDKKQLINISFSGFNIQEFCDKSALKTFLKFFNKHHEMLYIFNDINMCKLFCYDEDYYVNIYPICKILHYAHMSMLESEKKKLVEIRKPEQDITSTPLPLNNVKIGIFYTCFLYFSLSFSLFVSLSFSLFSLKYVKL